MMLAWFKAYRTRRAAARKERDTLIKMVDLLKESERELQRVYVELALVPVDMAARDYPDGKVLNCVSCGKRFVHNNKHCALGYCQECS